MTAAVFLDRDGVLNAKAPEGRYVTGWADFRMLPGVDTALRQLRRRDPGVRLIVVTNQRGVALGEVSEAALEDLHQRMRQALEIAGVPLDGIYACPHEKDACTCRKPGVGLLEQARADMPDIEPELSAMVGDSLADLEAGHAFGCRVFLVGDQARRRVVLARATGRGIPVAGDALSLPALVRDHLIVSKGGEGVGLPPAVPRAT